MTSTPYRGRPPAAVIFAGIALSLSACSVGTSPTGDTSSPAASQPLGATIHVHGSDLTHDGADYDGTVAAESPPVQCRRADGSQTLAIHIQAHASKGGIPTAYWAIETENAVPISNEGLDQPDIGKPPLGPLVSGDAKGYITFTIPPRTTPTGLDLLANIDAGGQKLAHWTIGALPAATKPCPPAS